MADNFLQTYIHIVFAVAGRHAGLRKEIRQQVFKYMSAIIAEKGHKPIIVNGMQDHVHILVGLNPTKTISDLVRDVKCNSSKFIKEKKFVMHGFAWQEGYGAFSCSHKDLSKVYNYIAKQEEHHSKKSFREEYTEFLKATGQIPNERFLFSD